MTSLRPRLDIQGCHCTHVEPWLNPEELADLWYFEGPPDSQDKLARIFAAGEQRLFFVGHYHSWLLATPDEILDWQGEQPIVLRPPQRFYVVIGALCQGRFAIFDTGTAELVPLQTE